MPGDYCKNPSKGNEALIPGKDSGDGKEWFPPSETCVCLHSPWGKEPPFTKLQLHTRQCPGHFVFIIQLNPPHNPVQQVLFYPHFTNKETETLRGQMTYWSPQSKLVLRLGLEPKPVSKPHAIIVTLTVWSQGKEPKSFDSAEVSFPWTTDISEISRERSGVHNCNLNCP